MHILGPVDLWLVARCRQTCPVDSYDLLEHPITSLIRYVITPAVGVTCWCHLLVSHCASLVNDIDKFRLYIYFDPKPKHTFERPSVDIPDKFMSAIEWYVIRLVWCGSMQWLKSLLFATVSNLLDTLDL